MISHRSANTLRVTLILLVILGIGGYLRFMEIGTLPPGLYRDEAFYGLDALNVLHGKFALFFAANNGREGLFIYLLTVGIALFGRTPEALRIVSASIGLLTIIALYFAGRRLFSPRIGLLSAAILAGTFWHVALSRVAFRAITLPLLLCVTVALWAASRTTTSPQQTRLLSVLAGAAFGMTFYTYTSGQFLIALALAWAIWHLRVNRRQHALGGVQNFQNRAITPYLVGAVATLLPFGLWLLRHSDLYFVRAGQVSILNPLINHGNFSTTLLDHIRAAALMFTQTGDRIWRHNLSLRPVFDGPLALAFVIGVGVCLWSAIKELSVLHAARQTPPMPTTPFRNSPFSILHSLHSHALILFWLLIFLVPTILAEDTPHFLRAIGALPAACLVAAVGLEAGLAWLSRRGWLMVMGRLSRHISPPALIATLIVAYSGYNTYQAYFNDYVHQPLTGYWLEQQNVALANEINAWVGNHPQRPQTLWLQDRLSDNNAALRFLSPAIETVQVNIFHSDENRLPLQPPSDWSGLILLDPNHPWGTLRAALPAVPMHIAIHEGAWAQGDLEAQPRRAYIGLMAAPAPTLDPPIAMFEPNITLAATHWISNSEDPKANVTLELDWQIAAAPAQDYSVFVHWQRGDTVVAQSDHSPTFGHWPMPQWRVGDVIVSQYTLTLPGLPEPGDEIRIGLYDLGTGKRLPATTLRDKTTGEWVIIPPPR